MVSARLGRRTVTFSRGVRAVAAGHRYVFVMGLGPRILRSRRLTVGVRYLGDGQYAAQTVRRVLRVPAAKRRGF